MIVYNRVLRGGLWLNRRKKWLPLAYILSASIAILMATPFSIIHSTMLLTVVSIAIAVVGLVVRCYADRRPSSKIEQTIAVAGIYSVIRFPYYLADMLLMLSLTIYTGVTWYMLMMIPVGYFICERIILSEENSLLNKYGDIYRNWTKETNALIPVMLNWSRSTYKISLFTLLRRESRTVLMTIGGFCLINLLKHVVVEFSFTIGAGWLLALLCAVVIFILSRLSSNKK